jgi:hypothetical protein
MLLAAGVATPAEQAATSMRVSVVIPPRVRLAAQAPTQLEVTIQDVARGYVEVRTPTDIAVRSNGAFGVLLDVRVPRGLFTGMRIEGDTVADLPGEGGTVTLQWVAPTAGGERQLRWTYRFALDPAVQPGRYVWPVQLAGQPAPG